MATKPKAIKQDAMLQRKGLITVVSKDQTREEQAREYARTMVSPELAAFRVLRGSDSKGDTCNLWDKLDEPSLTDELRAQAEAVNRGEMNHVEAMLINQATGLQNLFARLVGRGMGCGHAPAFEVNMRIALRAQSQCRATLETLAAIKNPPVVFARQANINQGNGNQQVNNGTPAPTTPNDSHAHAHAGENIIQPNELITEGTNDATLDTRGTAAAIRNNPAMATMGKVNGRTHAGRKSKVIA